MGIMPCPKALPSLDAICVTLAGVGGETFLLPCVIPNKNPRSSCCWQPWQALGPCVGHWELFSSNVIEQRPGASSREPLDPRMCQGLQGKGMRKEHSPRAGTLELCRAQQLRGETVTSSLSGGNLRHGRGSKLWKQCLDTARCGIHCSSMPFMTCMCW